MAFSSALFTVLGRDGHKSHQLDLPRQQLAHVRVIFDNEDFLHPFRLFSEELSAF